MRSPEVLEPTPELELIPETPEVPKLIAALQLAEDVRAAAARAIPPGEGGPATALARASEEPPVGEPPASTPPAEAPPPGQPERPPVPAQDPPSPEPPVTEPPSGPVIQALVNELEPSTAPPPLELRPLMPGTYLQTPFGPLWIGAVGKVAAGVQYYEAQTWDGRKVDLQEAVGEAAWRLQGKSALLSPVRTPGSPLLLERFELNGHYYVVTEPDSSEKPVESGSLQAA